MHRLGCHGLLLCALRLLVHVLTGERRVRRVVRSQRLEGTRTRSQNVQHLRHCEIRVNTTGQPSAMPSHMPS